MSEFVFYAAVKAAQGKHEAHDLIVKKNGSRDEERCSLCCCFCASSIGPAHFGKKWVLNGE
jgi:hypothetical protein